MQATPAPTTPRPYREFDCAACGENCATRDPDLTLCDECESASILDCCECGDTIERERAARYGWHVDGDIAMCRDCEYQAARV